MVSHERSGTHFLMNTLRLNFGYLHYTDLDERPGFDPRSTPQLLTFLLAGWSPRAVLKSHHPVDLLPPLPLLADVFDLIYVLRDPRDALLSFWRFTTASGPGTGPPAAARRARVPSRPRGERRPSGRLHSCRSGVHARRGRRHHAPPRLRAGLSRRPYVEGFAGAAGDGAAQDVR